MQKRFEAKEGHEIRGMMIRLYPTKLQEEALSRIEDDLRTAWNFLVKQTEDTLDANKAYAVKKGLAGQAPIAPVYDGLSPEESKSARREYHAKLKEWGSDVYKATKGLPECKFRNLAGRPGTGTLLEHFGYRHDYQLLGRVIDWKYERMVNDDGEVPERVKIGSSLLQSLAKNHRQKSLRRKNFRKGHEAMPIQVRSGDCFDLGDFGSRGSTHRRESPSPNFYDCQIKINGLKIRGRLPGKVPEGRVLEGVSVTKKADGWWASIKQEVPKRILAEPVENSVVGIDVGLVNVVALSEVRIVSKPEASTFEQQGAALAGSKPVAISNKRDGIFSERIAGLQAQSQAFRDAKDFVKADKKMRQGARLHLKAARHMKHLLYNDVVKRLALVETIKVEKLSGRIGTMGGSVKVSVMRTAVRMLQERYGDRVREVEPHFTSQDCSHCGHRSKESWSYEHGRHGECPHCGHREDRDLNAARNVAAKPPISLAA